MSDEVTIERRSESSPAPVSEATEPAGWVVPLFGLAALLLVPWAVVLAVALPSAHRAAHWDIAWVGFDVALALLLLAVAAAAWRHSPWVEGAASASATLLFVDAWFDVLTASTRGELVVAICEAAFVELPLAVLCVLLARDAQRRLRLPTLGRSATPQPRLRLVGADPISASAADDALDDSVALAARWRRSLSR